MATTALTPEPRRREEEQDVYTEEEGDDQGLQDETQPLRSRAARTHVTVPFQDEPGGHSNPYQVAASVAEKGRPAWLESQGTMASENSKEPLTVGERGLLAAALLGNVNSLQPNECSANVSPERRGSDERTLAASPLPKLDSRLSRVYSETEVAGGSAWKGNDLDAMIDQITTSSKRGLDDQRVCLSANQEQKMELAKLTGCLDKAARSRMDNQEWQSLTQRRHSDMAILTKKLQNTHSQSMDVDQRFTLSLAKERDMFFVNLVGKMTGRRLAGQDTESPATRRDSRFREIERALDRMPPAMDEQKFVGRQEIDRGPKSAPARVESQEHSSSIPFVAVAKT